MILITVFTALMIAFVVKLILFAIQLAWGIVKCVGYIVLLPAILIAMVVFGLVKLALPLLIVCGVILLLSDKSKA